MKNGSGLTEAPEAQLSSIKSRYTNNFTSISTETMLSDMLTVLNMLESSGYSKDPRVTIELAKLRKENHSLRKELAKFFPNKDSIETTSKKLEHLFKIDANSLIRYENSDLKEKNEKLLNEIEKIRLKSEELAAKVKDEQVNSQKLKEISAELRMENTNFIMKNRELTKKVKVFEENNAVIEELKEKLKTALEGKTIEVPNNEKSSDFSSFQPSAFKPCRLDVSHESSTSLVSNSKKKVQQICNLFKISIKSTSRVKSKLFLQHSSHLFCEPQKKPVQARTEKVSSLKPALFIQNQLSLFCKPRKTIPKTPAPVPSSLPVRKPVKLQLVAESSLSCRGLKKSSKRLRLRVFPVISMEIKARPRRLAMENQDGPRSLTLAKCSSIVVKAKLRSRERLLPTRKLSVSKTMSASLKPKPRKMMISKPSTSSLLPKPKERFLQTSRPTSCSLVPDPKALSLYIKTIYNRAESEEFEVFNPANVYKPDLTFSRPDFLSCVSAKTTKKVLKIETSTIGCKKKTQRLKISSFQVINQETAKVVVQKFMVFKVRKELQLQNLRRMTYVPENKATDDEETKSNPGGRTRKPRTPARKPAIEEYFNLVRVNQTFQAVKMNFTERDKVAGINCDELQARALQSGIQFNMYHDWVKEQFVMTANNAAKRPSVMVKK